jgi:hypothetical protein
VTRRARERDRRVTAARRRRRERTARRTAATAVVVLALWLAVRAVAGPGPADYAAGVITGTVAAVVLPDALRRPGERWARSAGVAVRAAVARPVPRTQRPARTPIHDTAEYAQRGTE